MSWHVELACVGHTLYVVGPVARDHCLSITVILTGLFDLSIPVGRDGVCVFPCEFRYHQNPRLSYIPSS